MAPFTVTVGVYNNAGTVIESVRGPYTISLSLTPTGTFSGTVSSSTSSGVISFTPLRILTWNTFTLTAQSASITSAVTAQFTTTNYVHTIGITTSDSTPSMNFAFTLTITLKGEDTNAFTGTCVIALTESTSSLAGTTSSSITGGTGQMSVYFTSTGSKTITATCPASGSNTDKTQTISITVQSLIIKVNSISPTVISP